MNRGTTASPLARERDNIRGNATDNTTTRGMQTRSTGDEYFSERSTLTSFRGSTGTFRSSTSKAHEPLPRQYTTYSHSGSRSWSYYGTYSTGSYGGYYGGPYYYSGHSFGFSIGFGSGFFGWGYSPFGFHYRPHVYHGAFATAWLVGTAWHITAHHSGWWGYNFGRHCYYWPVQHWRRHHRHCYNGVYFRTYRPYWYGYSRWYDYSPYRYGYSTAVYDDLYDDGYDAGYNRGYVEGAEDTSAYKDSRRRDQLGSKPRPRVPDSTLDRARTDANEEFRHEMTRGTSAFETGDFKAATRAFKEAVILSPNSADARYSLAVSAFAEGKYAFAAFALRRGITLAPDNSDIDVQRVFDDPVQFKGYRDRLNSELAANPQDPDLLLLHGFMALRTGDAATAADSLDRALGQNPQDEAARYLQRQAMDALENE